MSRCSRSWPPGRPIWATAIQAQTYPDSQNLFSLGKGAIYPAGSWDISTFRVAGQVPDGRLPAAAAGRREGLLHLRPRRHRDGPELGVQEQGGRARNSSNGWRRREFATLYANALPGFFPLSKDAVKIDDDLAATIVAWRKDCKSTIRNSYQILSRGTPNLENELWNVSAQVINGAETPEAAGKQLQDGLDKWYKPDMK